MDRSIEFTLLSVAYSQNSFGGFEETTTERKVFGQITSVSRDEFFSAGQNGFKPEYRITMFAFDYLGEKRCVFEGQEYSIYRTYFGRNDTVELYLEKRAGDHETPEEDESR